MKLFITVLLVSVLLVGCATFDVMWDEPTSYVEYKGMKIQFGLRSDGVMVWRQIE